MNKGICFSFLILAAQFRNDEFALSFDVIIHLLVHRFDLTRLDYVWLAWIGLY